MKRQREVEYVECDGCGYTIGNARMAVLTIPWRFDGSDQGVLEFHFHAPRPAAAEHDCLRYWLIGTWIMEPTLKNRGLSEADIDVFTAQMGIRNKVSA